MNMKNIFRPGVPLLGIDWGSSNRRAYLLDPAGALVRRHDDACGMLAASGRFPQALQELLDTFGLEQANVLMSGMVGSRSGWQQVPYVDCTVPLAQLSQHLQQVPFERPGVRCAIVPGYRHVDAHGAPDVMRGEEMQILGARALGAGDGWFVLPGTHSKWVRVADGHVAEIVTFMTGELFSLMTRHGTLAAALPPQPWPWHEEAFHAGLEAAQHGGFTHNAFVCRARVVTDAMPAAHATSYLSGLLIGAEFQHIEDRLKHRLQDGAAAVQLIGAPDLVAHYVAALAWRGLGSLVWQADQVFQEAVRSLALPSAGSVGSVGLTPQEAS